MALPEYHPLNEVVVWAHLADVSTPSSAFAVAPVRGKIIKLGSVIYNAITVADSAVTSKIAGTAITGGSWTISQSGAVAGDVDTALPTAANTVVEDQVIEFISDGASSTVCPAMFFAVIRKS
jgi:hypothetical protein